MSHTFEASSGTRFHFNSDFSGTVEIRRGDQSFKVGGSDLIEFAADEMLRSVIRRWLEGSDLLRKVQGGRK